MPRSLAGQLSGLVWALSQSSLDTLSRSGFSALQPREPRS
jgi:hypothetical protein